MKKFTLAEALKEIAYLFPFQPMGKIEDIEKIEYAATSGRDCFNIEMFDGTKYFIDLDGQTFEVIED